MLNMVTYTRIGFIMVKKLVKVISFYIKWLACGNIHLVRDGFKSQPARRLTGGYSRLPPVGPCSANYKQ